MLKVTTLILSILTCQFILSAQNSSNAGTIAKITGANVIIKYSNPKTPFKINDILHTEINNEEIRLIVFFPMQSSAKCKLIKNDDQILRKLHPGMTVYFGIKSDTITEQDSIKQPWNISLSELRALANNNDEQAMLELGERYCRGSGGISINYDKAHTIFSKLEFKKNPVALFNLGIMYREKMGVAKDINRSANYFLTCQNKLSVLADTNNAPAQYAKGICCEMGYGGEVTNEALAVEWYKKAASQNYISAYTRLGVCYMTGTGITKDLGIAIKWFTKAAFFEDTQAQANLGICYENGIGVEKNLKVATSWYAKAASRGNSFARGRLQMLVNSQM